MALNCHLNCQGHVQQKFSSCHRLPPFYPLKILFVFNRPGVAGAVLQTPLSLIHSIIHKVTRPFPSNLQNTFLHSQTVWARYLKLWENVQFPTCVSCHMSRVTYHMSDVVRCQMSHFSFFFLFLFLSGAAFWWRVSYRWGLPRLVSWRETAFFPMYEICFPS